MEKKKNETEVTKLLKWQLQNRKQLCKSGGQQRWKKCCSRCGNNTAAFY